jgi:hypothetical protein
LGRACSTLGAKRKSYRILLGKLEEKRPLESPRHRCEPLFSEQDRGQGRHLLVGVVLQASLVEVGISRKETGNNAGPLRESQTGSGCESETGVGYGIRESGQTGQTN